MTKNAKYSRVISFWTFPLKKLRRMCCGKIRVMEYFFHNLSTSTNSGFPSLCAGTNVAKRDLRNNKNYWIGSV